MSYKDYLTRYGSPADSAEIRPYIYITAPEKMTATKDVVRRDGMIAGSIAEAFYGVPEDLQAKAILSVFPICVKLF